MAFGLNKAEVIGRLGADVTINHLASGGRVANGDAGSADRPGITDQAIAGARTVRYKPERRIN